MLANDSDPSGKPLTAALVAGPADGALTLNPNGSFSYTPKSGFYGADSFTYRDSDGTLQSNTATVALTVTQPPAPPPTAPTNLTATGGVGQVSLSWKASSSGGVSNYLVYCENPGSSTFVQVGTTNGTTTTYTDTGLAASSTYGYKVEASNAEGNSPFSNVATATTSAGNPGLVAAYSFDEGTGTTVHDASGNGNNGTISGATGGPPASTARR